MRCLLCVLLFRYNKVLRNKDAAKYSASDMSAILGHTPSASAFPQFQAISAPPAAGSSGSSLHSSGRARKRSRSDLSVESSSRSLSNSVIAGSIAADVIAWHSAAPLAAATEPNEATEADAAQQETKKKSKRDANGKKISKKERREKTAPADAPG